MFPVVKLQLYIVIFKVYFCTSISQKCKIATVNSKGFSKLCVIVENLSISSMIALLKVYLEFCIYDELKCVNILSPIFEPISGSSRKSRENFQIPFQQQCEKERERISMQTIQYLSHQQVCQNLLESSSSAKLLNTPLKQLEAIVFLLLCVYNNSISQYRGK